MGRSYLLHIQEKALKLIPNNLMVYIIPKASPRLPTTLNLRDGVDVIKRIVFAIG